MNRNLLCIAFTCMLVHATLIGNQDNIIEDVTSQIEKEVAGVRECSSRHDTPETEKPIDFYDISFFAVYDDLRDLVINLKNYFILEQNDNTSKKYPKIQDNLNDHLLASAQEKDLSIYEKICNWFDDRQHWIYGQKKSADSAVGYSFSDPDTVYTDPYSFIVESSDIATNRTFDFKQEAEKHYSFVDPDTIVVDDFDTKLYEPSEFKKACLVAYKMCENGKNSFLDKMRELFDGFKLIDKDAQIEKQDSTKIEPEAAEHKNDKKQQSVQLSQKIQKQNQDIKVLDKKYSKFKVAAVVGVVSFICYEAFQYYKGLDK